MDTLNKMATLIIKEQEQVIGPLAWREAGKVQGLTIVNRERSEISIKGEDQKQVVDRLVTQYERLFGPASHEVCREAVAGLISHISAAEIPASLR